MFRGRVEEREDTRHDYGERRFIAVGELDGDIISVVYTSRGNRRRRINLLQWFTDRRRLYQDEINDALRAYMNVHRDED